MNKRKKADAYLIEAMDRLQNGSAGWLIPVMKFLAMVAEELWGKSTEVVVVDDEEKVD
jgi:hypothetical protein